ncbi:hypothetical protein AAFP35_10865 [Gordonia sp. CPCC 206044]
MNRSAGRVILALVAGLAIGAGFDFDAFNSWWVALSVGVPLIVVGFALPPRATRVLQSSSTAGSPRFG